MQVDGINPHGVHAGQLKNLHRPDEQVKHTVQEQPGVGEAFDVSVTAAQVSGEESNNNEDSKGVIRLLQEGHFKGVADVRLRINFHKELAAIEAGQLKAAAQEKIGGILESVGPGVGPLLASSEPTEEPDGVSELREAFVETVNQLKEDFLAAETPSTDTLVEGTRSAFDEFVGALWNLSTLAGEAEEQDLQSYVDNLTSAFEAAMDELIGAFGEVEVLPELSEQSGNGAAYEKFVAIYNELWGIGVSSEVPDEDEPLDSTV
jgi:hypothetical protein